MTKNDVKNYLNEYRETSMIYQTYVFSLNCALDRTKSARSSYALSVREKVTQELQATEEDFIRRSERIVTLFSMISNENHRRVMQTRYIDGKNWETVMTMCNYEQSQVFNINNKCCAEIASKLNCRKFKEEL